jgi:hypothetical protein
MEVREKTLQGYRATGVSPESLCLEPQVVAKLFMESNLMYWRHMIVPCTDRRARSNFNRGVLSGLPQPFVRHCVYQRSWAQ